MTYLRTLVILAGALALGGCGVNYEKIDNELRTKNLKQEQEIAALKSTAANRDATIAELQKRADDKTPRVETLPAARLAEMYTAARVEIRSQTDAWDWQGDKSPDGFRVFLRVVAEGGEVLPATGTLTIEAFDLAVPEGSQRVGTWTFTPEQMKKAWYSALGMNHFALNCAWEKPPTHTDITFKVKFVDALTGCVLVDQMHKNVKLGG